MSLLISTKAGLRGLLLGSLDVLGSLLGGHVACLDDERILELVAVWVVAADLDELVPSARGGLQLGRHRVGLDIVVPLLGDFTIGVNHRALQQEEVAIEPLVPRVLRGAGGTVTLRIPYDLEAHRGPIVGYTDV